MQHRDVIGEHSDALEFARDPCVRAFLAIERSQQCYGFSTERSNNASERSNNASERNNALAIYVNASFF